LLLAIQRGPYLILASVFPLEALAASFPAQLMVEMPQLSAFTFGGPLQQGQRGRRCGLNITYLAGRKHLPIVELKKAA